MALFCFNEAIILLVTPFKKVYYKRGEWFLKVYSMRLTVTRTLSALVVIITLALLGVFIFGIDPETLTRTGEWGFFGLWFFFLQNSVFLFLLSLSERFLGEERTTVYQGAAWRQGALLAFLLTSIMAAQYFRVLTWWGALFLLAFLLLLELTYRYFQSLKR